ncbi:MAG TPA: glycoside hydrolase, partial [Actinopolymorphaceae bacterium]|nr:glycoside hydrolase [Actinopolymorphaceae bacterium]
MRRALLVWGLVFALAPFVAPPVATAAPSGVIVDGHARFEVLTPTLIRLEYAADGTFEDATTFNVVNRDFPVPQYTTGVVDGWREIHTEKMTVRYREDSGPFSPQNTAITVPIDGTWQTEHPS